MEHFYTQLWQRKQTPLQPLRSAQLFVLKNPERLRQRVNEVGALLVKCGVGEEALAARGQGKKAGTLPAGSSAKGAKRSPVATSTRSPCRSKRPCPSGACRGSWLSSP
jgi:hypothetical protein